MKDFIKQNLEKYSEFRERKNKNKWIGGFIFKKYDIERTPAIKDKLADIVADIMSADRAWRKVLEENETLRGSDYNDKDILEQEAQLQLGYTPNYQQDIDKRFEDL